MSYAIVAIGFANGAPCPHADHWLQSFDHEAYGGQGFGNFTKDPDKAMRFLSAADAWTFWNTQSKVNPVRPDGKPNKPLTALTVSIEPLP